MTIKVIAEIGVNHDGKIDKALRLVDAAAAAGADVVKTQSFVAELLVSEGAERARYQVLNDPTHSGQLEMLKSLELTSQEQLVIKEYSENIGLEFLSTPFDSESLRMLINELGMERIKVASSDIVSVPFLYEIGKYGVSVLVSTGLTEGNEIDLGLASLAAGNCGVELSQVTPQACSSLIEQPLLGDYLKKKVTLMHCVSAYPSELADMNLNVIKALRSRYGLPIGFSDHSRGLIASVVAAALGAVVIEKHLTLDKTSPGPDHQASLEPSEFKALCSQIREVSTVLGDGQRRLTPGEIENRTPARKQVIAVSEIHPGTRFTPENIGIRRPCKGLPASQFATLLGLEAKRHYKIGEAIEP